jgi:hypothetical protein
LSQAIHFDGVAADIDGAQEGEVTWHGVVDPREAAELSAGLTET